MSGNENNGNGFEEAQKPGPSGVYVEGEPPGMSAKKNTTLPDALRHYHAKSRDSFLEHWKNVFKENDIN
jgi:hypothetical protein